MGAGGSDEKPPKPLPRSLPDHKEALVSPGSGSSGRASSSGGFGAAQSVNNGDGELGGDRDVNIKSENSNLGVDYDDEDQDSNIKYENCNHCGGGNDDDEESPRKAKEVPGSYKRKHANKGPKVPTCPECGKTFPSDKSLYGHLRCHPERDYRGANRPTNAMKRPQADADHSSVALATSTKWLITARRGHRRMTTDDDDEDAESTAASTLLLMANAEHWGPGTTTVKEEQTETKQVPGIHFDDADDKYVNELMSSYKRIKKKKMMMKELELAKSNTSTHGRSYECSVCFKTFSSHQALGGHRASHKKNKSNPEEQVMMMVDENCEGANLKYDEELVHANNAVTTKVAITEHRCKSCNLAFPTGQALGGHQRRHFNELRNRAPVPSSSAHSSESEKGANRGLFYHLNDLHNNTAPVPPASAHSSERSESDNEANHGQFHPLNELHNNTAPAPPASARSSERCESCKGENHVQFHHLNELHNNPAPAPAPSSSVHSSERSESDKVANNHGLFNFDLNEVPNLE